MMLKSHPYWLPRALMLLVFAGTPAVFAETAPTGGAEFREPGAAAEPERLLGLAIYLLVVIAILTVSLLIILMLWGVRVRRQVRKPLSPVHPPDPLWYLKTKKHPATEPGRPRNESEEKEPPEKPADESRSG
jgi:hypothetical protein